MNNMKMATKKMGGFTCRSPAATAICHSTDPRSVIVPRKAERRLMSNGNYSRLIESPHFRVAKTKPLSVALACSKTEQQLQLQGYNNNSISLNKPPDLSLPPSNHAVFQVVVMRVSLHCQGCASKVKRHLSKMEGVTSFSIDLEAKRVTVMGHVSPAGVLESISKVKRAEFWPR